MFFFGHLGIGQHLVKPFSKGLPIFPIFLGTLLPDMIDKPLYYGMIWYTRQRGPGLGLIDSTRTFGHTAVFLLLLCFWAMVRKSLWLAGLCLGVGTHLVLDSLWNPRGLNLANAPSIESYFLHTELLWPFTGWSFPVSPFHHFSDQFSYLSHPYFIWTELLGIALLAWDFAKVRKSRAPKRSKAKSKSRRA